MVTITTFYCRTTAPYLASRHAARIAQASRQAGKQASKHGDLVSTSEKRGNHILVEWEGRRRGEAVGVDSETARQLTMAACKSKLTLTNSILTPRSMLLFQPAHIAVFLNSEVLSPPTKLRRIA